MDRSRRVISGIAPDGRSAVLREEDLGPLPVAMPQSIWRMDDWPAVPNDGAGSTSTVFPTNRGVWVVKWALAAHETATSGNDMVAMAEDEPGFHSTQSVDVTVVLAGRVTIEFDDGETRTLAEGDTVVVNGNRHAWHNRHPQRCTLMSVIVGARAADQLDRPS